jgi:hypothetical protein
MERSPTDAATYKLRQLRNSGEAYRQFRSTGVLVGVHEMLIGLLRHRMVGGAIVLMGTVGLIGLLITFWPR